MLGQGARPLSNRQGRGQPLEISEQESNMMKTGTKAYSTEGKWLYFLSTEP